MKATGIVRKLDSLGRIVIPMEIRRVLHLNMKDMVEIFTEGESIVIKKHQWRCVFCDSAEELVLYKTKRICASCQKAITQMKG